VTVGVAGATTGSCVQADRIITHEEIRTREKHENFFTVELPLKKIPA